MKLKLLFWSAVLLAVIGAYSAEGTLFYFFATHLIMIATGMCMIRRDQKSRTGAAAKAPAGKTSSAASRA
ncbi:MAG: hypothetical protein HY895_00075 [Deltaproteobacteria bacterium]|nr:hypothetical protein [Deltaproteobacteria bacterium]